MHILIIHQAFASPDDAGGTRHYELANYLTDAGHQVTVIASDVCYLSGKRTTDEKRGQSLGKVQILRARTYERINTGFRGRLISFLIFMLTSFYHSLRIKNIDIVYGTSPPITQGLSAYLLSRVKGIPFVLEVRDLWPDFMISLGVIRNPIVIRASKLIEKFLYEKANAIIINSPGFNEHVRAVAGKKKNIYLVPNGVDTSLFDKCGDGTTFREEINVGDNQCVVLYAGAIGKANDIKTLIDAAKELSEINDLVFVLVGGGIEENKMKEYVRHLDLGNIVFVNPQPKKRMPEIIAASDITVAILKNIEFFKTTYPNKVFDYMAGGKPIVLAIDGVIREVVEEARAGIFAEPGNPKAIAEAIRTLYYDSKKRREMGKNGRKYVKQHFERKEHARELERILLKVGNKKR